jgi:hypothetical protein
LTRPSTPSSERELACSFSAMTSNTFKSDVILGLDPRIHAASHGPTNVLAEPAFRGGSWFLQPGVDGRVKPNHDKVFDNAGNSKPDSRGLDPRIHAASHGLTNVLAGLAFGGGGWCVRPGVDGRVKPDHDDLIEFRYFFLPGSRRSSPRMTCFFFDVTLWRIRGEASRRRP